MSSIKAKGKKRVLENLLAGEDTGVTGLGQRKVKKPKRADIRKCPVCDDDIPVRLLASHVEFELQRVEEICCARIEDNDLLPWEQIEADALGAAGPSRRGAAVKARLSLTASSGPGSQSSSSLHGLGMRRSDLLIQVSKAIKLVQRHRRERHLNLKELFKADGENDGKNRENGGENACPVCQTVVSGDADVIEAHIDACLAHAVTSVAAARVDLETDGLEEYEIGGETRIRISRSVDFRGAGFDVRNPLQGDVDDEIDVDGDDVEVFGDAQFTEGDIIIPENLNSGEDEEVRVDSEADGEIPIARREGARTSLRDLVARKKIVPNTDNEGATASAGIIATDSAGLGGPTCRICLDAYTEPTVSTGCWHTCCRECWLRCLGTTKLCPICKRITAASELRRIYL